MVLSSNVVEVLGPTNSMFWVSLVSLYNSSSQIDVLFLYPWLRSWCLLGLFVLFAGAIGGRSLAGLDVEKAGHRRYNGFLRDLCLEKVSQYSMFTMRLENFAGLVRAWMEEVAIVMIR